MRVHCDGVGEVGAGHFVGVGGRKDDGGSPGTIDVQPDVVGGADGRDGAEWVVGAEDCGACCCVYCEESALVFDGPGVIISELRGKIAFYVL